MNPLFDEDISLDPLRNKRIAVCGYGNQGHAHALNMRDSGLNVFIGCRPGGSGHQRAEQDGFDPLPIPSAVTESDLIIIALPDELAPSIFETSIRQQLKPGCAIGFVHGFNIHYKRIAAPHDADIIMVAPKGAGYMVRKAYGTGSGLPCLYAVDADVSGHARQLAWAWAKAIGGGRAGILETTFQSETETDLFGEQSAVVGGVVAMMKASFDTLVDAGYAAEQAYFECVHEVKFVVDLIHEHGITGMRHHISKTAAFGDVSRNQRLYSTLKPVMGQLLAEIRSGDFAQELASAASGQRLQELLDSDRDTQLEVVGAEVRRMIRDRKDRTSQ